MAKSFLQLIGLSALFPATAADKTNAALLTERDQAVAALDKAATGYADLQSAHDRLLTERDTLRTAASDHADALAAAAKKVTDLEASLPARVRQEAATLCAAQGIRLRDVPSNGQGDTGDRAAELQTAITAMQAEPDPVKKGILAARVRALRAPAKSDV